MPLYPFIAYFLAKYLLRLVEIRSRSLKVYGSFLAILGLLISIGFIAIKFGMIPDSVFGTGKHAMQNAAMMHEIGNVGFVGSILALVPAMMAILWFRWIAAHRGYTDCLLWGICCLTFGLYFAIDGAFQPRIFAAKSQRVVAAEIEAVAPASAGTLYEYIAAAEQAAGDPVHFFELDFYLNDRIHGFLKESPNEGFLLITDEDATAAIPRFQAEGYEFFPLHETSRPVLFHRPAIIYRFQKTDRPSLREAK